MATRQYLDFGVMPSGLGVRRVGTALSGGGLSETSLLVGEVRSLNLPHNSRDPSSAQITYDVDVKHRRGSAGTVTIRLYRCRVANLFGGVADSFSFTLRPDTGKSDKTYGNGSQVLVLCENGNRQQAYIIGGVPQDVDTGSNGHHLDWEFNGVHVNIDQDGSLLLSVAGATDVTGKSSNDKLPAALAISSDGSIFLDDVEGSGFSVNHPDGHAQIDAKNNVQVQAGAQITLKSAGTLIGEATDAFPLFSTYRTQEQALHQTLQTVLAGVNTTVSGLAVATASASAGAAAVPSGAALAAALSTMAMAMQQLQPLLIQAQTAISQFEAQAQTYLSPTNKND